MDNPFIGLDAQTRDQLKDLMTMLAKEQGLQIILVLAKTDEIPEFITHIVEVKEMKVMPKVSRKEEGGRRILLRLITSLKVISFLLPHSSFLERLSGSTTSPYGMGQGLY